MVWHGVAKSFLGYVANSMINSAAVERMKT